MRGFYVDVFGAAVGEVDDLLKEESHSQNHHRSTLHNSHTRIFSVKISKQAKFISLLLIIQILM